MSLTTIESAVRDGLETVVTDISQKVTALRPHLEELASMAEKAEQSPLMQAAMSVALSPELEQQLASLILQFAKLAGVPQPATAVPAAVTEYPAEAEPAAPVPA